MKKTVILNLKCEDIWKKWR